MFTLCSWKGLSSCISCSTQEILHLVGSSYVLCGLQAIISAPTNDPEVAFSISFLFSIFSSILTIFSPEYLSSSLQASPQKKDLYHQLPWDLVAMQRHFPCVYYSITDCRFNMCIEILVGMVQNGPRYHLVDLQT